MTQKNVTRKNEAPPVTEPFVSATKKAILADLGVETKQISEIRNNADADEYITYLEKKRENAKPKEDGADEKKPLSIQKQHENMKIQGTQLPPQNEATQKIYRQNVAEAMNPVSVKKVRSEHRWNNNARIMILFDEKTEYGSCF